MADKKPKSKSNKKADSRLKSFLRQATAIIAAEKGLNATSRVKLESLADHLKLTKKQFEEGLSLVQSNDTNLSHYEKAFVKFLDKEFAKIKGGVISLGIEKEAIDLADRKYQINSTRAEQLIESQAKAAGISRISPDEAAKFAKQIIVDRVGELTTVDDELRKILYKIGKKWAYSKKQVDRIIFQQINFNRAQRQSSRIKTGLVMLMIVMAIGVAVPFSLGWIPFNSNTEPIATKQPNDLKIKSSEVDAAAKSTFERLEQLAQTEETLQKQVGDIRSNDEIKRRLGYRQLTRAICLSDRFDKTNLSLLIEKLFYEEQSENAAMEILASVRESLELVPLDSGVSIARLKSSYRANQILGRISFSPVTDSDPMAVRRFQAIKTIQEMIQIPIDEDQGLPHYFEKSEAAIATDQWIRLLQASINSPATATVFLKPVYDLTSSKLPLEQLYDYRDEAIILIVKSDNAQFHHLKDLVQESLSACDETRLSQWISIHVESTNDEMKESIGPLLVKRTDIQPRSNSPSDINSAISSYERSIRLKQFEAVMTRDAELSRVTDEFLLNTSDGKLDVTPDQIAEIAIKVNSQMAFCAAIENAAKIDDTSFVEFDRLFALKPPRLRELISLPIDRSSNQATGPASATASDKRRKESALERLRQLKPGETGLRKLALDQLARVASRFETISYSEAQILSTYVLSDLGTEELLGVQQTIESFSHWPNFSLAIADQLPQSNVSQDQALTISRLLLGREFESQSQQNWKQALQSKIIESVSEDIAKLVDLDPNNLKSNWERLRIFIIDVYLARLAIVQMKEIVTQDDSGPDQIALTLLNTIGSTRGALQKSTWDQAPLIIRQAAQNEIARTVLANQFLIQALTDEFALTSIANESRQISQDHFADSPHARIAGEQIYRTELALLKLFSLKRKMLVTQLVQGDE